jgi:hypothetical protein
VKEITSENIRKLDNLFRIYTCIALFGGFVFLSSAAAKEWISAGVSLAIVLFAAFIGYRVEVEIDAQKKITAAVEQGRREKVAQYYRKETSDENRSEM